MSKLHNINLELKQILDKYDFNNIKDLKKILELPEQEKNNIIKIYNEEALKFSNLIISMVNRLNSSKDIQALFSAEIPVLKYLIGIPIEDKTAIFVPNFYESIHLQLVTGCRSAFIMEKPLRIVCFLDFMIKQNSLGKIFVLLHEAQHYTRYHSERKLNRDSINWNIATDAIINYDLLTKKLPKLMGIVYKDNQNIYETNDSEHVKNLKKEITRKNLILNDFLQDNYFNFIGNKEIINGMEDWSYFFKLISDNNLVEEQIYNYLENNNEKK